MFVIRARAGHRRIKHGRIIKNISGQGRPRAGQARIGLDQAELDGHKRPKQARSEHAGTWKSNMHIAGHDRTDQDRVGSMGQNMMDIEGTFLK